MARNTRKTEWRLEPVDADGDIIDPLSCKTEAEARRNIAPALGHFVDAVYVDVVKVTRTGNTDDGIVDEVYEYQTRHYRKVLASLEALA